MSIEEFTAWSAEEVVEGLFAELLGIEFVFVSACRFLIFDKVLFGNKRYYHALDYRLVPFLVSVLKIHAVYLRNNINSSRRHAYLKNNSLSDKGMTVNLI